MKTKVPHSFGKAPVAMTKSPKPKHEAKSRGGQMTASLQHSRAHQKKSGY